jgi:hypothetical protein
MRRGGHDSHTISGRGGLRTVVFGMVTGWCPGFKQVPDLLNQLDRPILIHITPCCTNRFFWKETLWLLIKA